MNRIIECYLDAWRNWNNFSGRTRRSGYWYAFLADVIIVFVLGILAGIADIFEVVSGLYSLVLSSKLPKAKQFRRWVTSEVLPSIRKHGAYLTRDKLWEVATSPEALLKLCTDLLAEREKNAALRADNARLQSKAVYYDLFIDLRHITNLRTTAKELDVPERRFVRFLLERRYVYRTPSGCVLPYAKGSNEGLFCVKDFCRNGHIGSYTLVTPKGKLHFAELRQLILVTV